MAWWGWVVMTLVCCLCIGVSIWVVSRKSKPIQVDQKALDEAQNKSLLEQLEAERKARQQIEEHNKRLEQQLAESQAQFQQGLSKMKKELADEKTALENDPDLLDGKLDQLLSTSPEEDPPES